MLDCPAPAPAPATTTVEVPWPHVEGFVGKLTHDLRNGLNALELQVTLIGELTEDPEIKEEIKRVRQSLTEQTRQLHSVRLATALPTVHLFPYPAGDFLEDLRERVQRQRADTADRVQWAIDVGTAAANIDPEQTMNAVLELLDNAIQHGAEGSMVRVEAAAENDGVRISLHQLLADAPSSPPKEWGFNPLHSTRRNAYGLGAFRARRILAAQGGTLEYRYSEVDRTLVTMVVLPTAEESARS